MGTHVQPSYKNIYTSKAHLTVILLSVVLPRFVLSSSDSSSLLSITTLLHWQTSLCLSCVLQTTEMLVPKVRPTKNLQTKPRPATRNLESLRIVALNSHNSPKQHLHLAPPHSPDPKRSQKMATTPVPLPNFQRIHHEPTHPRTLGGLGRMRKCYNMRQAQEWD